MPRVRIIHWKPNEAGPLIECVRAAGFTADYSEDLGGTAITQAIRGHLPDAVVIDLCRLPAHGKEIGVWLRGRKATRQIPLLFVGGDPVKVAKVREVLPDAVYTDQAGLAQALQCSPLVIQTPVIPAPMMERFAGRTAAQKMGVRDGTRAAVIDPPRDYLTVLGEMPPGAEIIEEPDEVQPVTIWFVHDPDSFLNALRRMGAIAGRTKLWVVWRKGSENGITQNLIRENAIDAGLVDCKICSVDGRWSGIAFARSKK